MRVLHVINSLATGGAEKLLVDTLPLLRDKGLDVSLLLLDGSEHPFLEILKTSNIPYFYITTGGSLYNPILIFKLIPYLRKYDIVHVHLFPAQYWVVLAKLLSFSSSKLIFTEHNTSNNRMQHKVLLPIERLIYSYYKLIVCITPQVLHVMVKYLKYNKDKLVIIENGVSVTSISKAIASKRNFISNLLTDSDVLLIMVAAFRDQKDHETLLKSMTLLPNNVKLILVGDGEKRKEIKESLNIKRLDNRVFLLGVRMDVPQLLKMSDIAILSSHWEGFGLVAVEGMASGRPFIATDVPGLADVVRGAGLLFNLGDEKDLASKIESLIADKEYALKISSQCEERAKMYDINFMIDKTIALYNSI